MNILVQKFGGTSVANTQMLYKVSEHIIREYERGNSLVVVVSAQGKKTNELIKEEKEITTKLNKREHDVLVSVGEQITIAKLAMCLKELGYKAKSFTGWQIPIITDENYGDANIINIRTDKILRELRAKKIVIVAGFQGVNNKGDITTLGRGGSDTTAVHLAAVLNAKICDIYTDVDGVYEEDPNKLHKSKYVCKISKKYETIA